MLRGFFWVLVPCLTGCPSDPPYVPVHHPDVEVRKLGNGAVRFTNTSEVDAAEFYMGCARQPASWDGMMWMTGPDTHFISSAIWENETLEPGHSRVWNGASQFELTDGGISCFAEPISARSQAPSNAEKHPPKP